MTRAHRFTGRRAAPSFALLAAGAVVLALAVVALAAPAKAQQPRDVRPPPPLTAPTPTAPSSPTPSVGPPPLSAPPPLQAPAQAVGDRPAPASAPTGTTTAGTADAGVASCLLVPSLDVSIGTPGDGVLAEATVDRGDTVQAGQVIARLNSAVEAATVDRIAAKVSFGERKRQRNADLQRRDLISQQEADEIETDLELSKLELREHREQLRLRSIFAPFQGVVVDRFRSKGDLVRQEKIYRLVQLDPLFGEVVMRADRFGQVRAGATVDVELPLLRRTVPGKVQTIDRVIDPASGTFRVRLTIANPRNEIPSGLRCQVGF